MTESLMKGTLPSVSRKLQPPGCWLLALAKFELPDEAPPDPKMQVPQRDCFELGGTIVLNRVTPTKPFVHWLPRSAPPGPLFLSMTRAWVSQLCRAAFTVATMVEASTTSSALFAGRKPTVSRRMSWLQELSPASASPKAIVLLVPSVTSLSL